ncbi:hypothetical protein CCR75_008559 [Bremia lactucae]|uniref:Uncharacterized protein n=1 Tax=Bremia lactucae TaxID=4779 RepID=A0A976FF48_BRELC|nr:hypothetical protein CCR75_008559 [Bremia lactucae]
MAAPYVTPSAVSSAQPRDHVLYSSYASTTDHTNTIQQQQATTELTRLPGHVNSQHEIKEMLEKNEAALKSWSTLHKHQPTKTSLTEHKEWVRKCLIFRKEVGTRLEVLASLADKQIAQEDDTKEEHQTSSTTSSANQGEIQTNLLLSTTLSAHQSTVVMSQSMYMTPQVPTLVSTNPMAMTTADAIESMNMLHMAAPTLFPEPPSPTVDFTSTSLNMFLPTGPMNLMQACNSFNPSTSIPGDSTSNYVISSEMPTFTPDAYMASSSSSLNSSTSFMSEPNFIMNCGLTTASEPHYMRLSMPMNPTHSESGNLYVNTNYGIVSASNNVDCENSTTNVGMDSIMTPLGFNSDGSFETQGFLIGNMPNLSTHQRQMMGLMNGGNYGAQGAPLMPNSFGYGGMPPSSNMMLESLPTSAFQPPSYPYQQTHQLAHHPHLQETGLGFINMTPDLAMYGDTNVNIFEGLTDDAFFPMQ